MHQLSRREVLKSILYASVAGFAPLIRSSGFAYHKTEMQPDNEPGYLRLHRSGELKKRGEMLWELMDNCELCPRMCGVNKFDGEKGFCQASAQLEISSFHPHFGQEGSLVGKGGSGTIFFTNCGLRCVFCIKWEVSQGGFGTERSIKDFSNMMLILQEAGCSNIHFVTPTHYLPHIVLALDIAASKGLRLPTIYSNCGWERVSILKILDGIIDIYIPEFKYSNNENAAKYSSGADTYADVAQKALLEMHRQVGIATTSSGTGLIIRGLMIRHLVMPNNVSGTKGVIDWIANNLPKDTYLNLMSQYRPMYKAHKYPEISRRTTRKEYDDAIVQALAAGLTNLYIQGYHLRLRR